MQSLRPVSNHSTSTEYQASDSVLRHGSDYHSSKSGTVAHLYNAVLTIHLSVTPGELGLSIVVVLAYGPVSTCVSCSAAMASTLVHCMWHVKVSVT